MSLEAILIDKAQRNAVHRRAFWGGIAVSVSAHVLALAILTVPGADPGAGEDEADRIAQNDFEAIELIELADPTPPTETTSAMSTAVATGAVAPADAPADAPSTASLAERLSDLRPATMVASIPQTSRPVVTFRNLRPVSQTAAMMAMFEYGDEFAEEENGGGIGGLLSSIGAALSGGGHCPTSGTASGPLILR